MHRCNGYKVQFIWFALLALADMGFTFSLTALTINTVAGIADSISWMNIGHWKFNICKFRPGANFVQQVLNHFIPRYENELFFEQRLQTFL